MRMLLAFSIALLASLPIWALQDEAPSSRFGVPANLRKYPQATHKEALESVVKAIEDKRIDYLDAHLADPDYVDKRVKDVHGGNFDELVRETTKKLADNPNTLKELKRFAKEGEWDTTEDTAKAKLKDLKDRQVSLRRFGKRWYLENAQKP